LSYPLQSLSLFRHTAGRSDQAHFWFIHLLVEQAATRELKKANLMILTLITADFL